ncbi:MAG: PEP-CTERM sorting domain-containing protein [Acidobacteriota bacterium]
MRTLSIVLGLLVLMVGCRQPAPDLEGDLPTEEIRPGPVKFIPLGVLGDPATETSQAFAVSEDGRFVVGSNFVENGPQEAFRWSAESGMIGLGFVPDLTGSGANGVSSDGSVVVGISFSRAGETAFRWTSSSGMQMLPQGGDPVVPSFALDVSADGGSIVGAANTATGHHAFLWTAAAGFRDLGVISGSTGTSEGQSVSGDGSVVVGISTDASQQDFAFRWTAAQGMVALQPLPGATDGSNGGGVSVDGTVAVGNSNFSTSQGLLPRATLWGSDGSPVDLGTLPGGGASQATAVSADGARVVGFASNASGDGEAFVWDAENGLRRLWDVLAQAGAGKGLVGWSLTSAADITPDGHTIVGVGTNPKGRQEAWLAAIP